MNDNWFVIVCWVNICVIVESGIWCSLIFFYYNKFKVVFNVFKGGKRLLKGVMIIILVFFVIEML